MKSAGSYKNEIVHIKYDVMEKKMKIRFKITAWVFYASFIALQLMILFEVGI